MGELTDPSSQFKSSNFKDIRQVILDKKKATPIGDLMYIIKSDKQATFKNAIDVLDEMSINEVPPGHYAEVDMSDTEAQLIKETETPTGLNKLWKLQNLESNYKSFYNGYKQNIKCGCS
jgi:hypothetical protein